MSIAKSGDEVAEGVAILNEWNYIAEMIEGWRRGRSHGHPPMSIVQIRRFRRDPPTIAHFPRRDWVESNFHVLAFRGRLRNGQTVFAQAFQVQGDSLGDQLFGLFSRESDGHAARQIGDISAVAGRAFFDDNRVAHQSSSGNVAASE